MCLAETQKFDRKIDDKLYMHVVHISSVAHDDLFVICLWILFSSSEKHMKLSELNKCPIAVPSFVRNYYIATALSFIGSHLHAGKSFTIPNLLIIIISTYLPFTCMNASAGYYQLEMISAQVLMDNTLCRSGLRSGYTRLFVEAMPDCI